VQPENFRFGGGASTTILHPVVLTALLLIVLLVLLLRRKYVIVPVLLGTFLIPQGQQFVLAGYHLFVLRIIILSALVRMMFSKRPSEGHRLAGGFNLIDKFFILWVSFHAVAFMLLYHVAGAVVNQVGYLWDGLGAYIALRFLIQDEEDVIKATKCFAVLAVILGVCMVREQLTGLNIFGSLGGVNQLSEVRDGRIRSQAVFQHSLLAGTFGATMIPLMVYLWKSGKAKLLAVVGSIGATLMAITAFGSTPLMAWFAGIAAVFFWPFRRQMRKVRWAAVGLLICLMLLMKAPVWFLIARVGVMSASSSYHRAMLVDGFVRHFSDWWLLGSNNNETWGTDMWDTSNRYVEEGVTGGLAAFLCFLGVICLGFSRVGRAIKLTGDDRQKEWLLWLLGATMFAHTVAFFGISYFDQTSMTWFALLAMISAVTAPLLHQAPVLQENPAYPNPVLSRTPYRPPVPANARSKFLHHKFER
jgi:hypothetical protein